MALEPIKLPQIFTPEWVKEVQERLNAASWNGTAALQKVLPKQVAVAILDRTERLVSKEPPLVEVVPQAGTEVIVVGDTHGQFHDVCHMFTIAGDPGPNRTFILNGDYVDRGAWGLEVLMLFCCWKLALPQNVFMIRGNHETALLTVLYGFKEEIKAKYGKGQWNSVHVACKKLFASLPLAALVNQQTLVLHGGLFRKQKQMKRSKRKHIEFDVLGDLNDLRKAPKGGLDPSGLGASRLATDVIWSDPNNKSGFIENESRGVGMLFGPEITEQFLKENALKLILRSHEGPDARRDREGMGNMLEGWTEDHVTESGRLLTVFSAPDYPQFMSPDEERHRNKAAVAVLRGPDYSNPAIKQYEAVPRPEASPYYDLNINDSDEELEHPASNVSGLTDARHEAIQEEEEESNEGDSWAAITVQNQDASEKSPASKRQRTSSTPMRSSPKKEDRGQVHP